MTLRSPRERILQAACYEVCALFLAVPLYLVYAGGPVTSGVMVLGAICLAEVLAGPLHDTVFDIVDHRLTGRVASDRTAGARLVHAVSHEVTLSAVCVPILVWMGGHGLLEAVAIDIVFSLVYVAFAYVFHLGFDRVRPVVRPPVHPVVRPVRVGPSGAYAS